MRLRIRKQLSVIVFALGYLVSPHESFSSFCKSIEGFPPSLFIQKPKSECSNSVQQAICLFNLECHFPGDSTAKEGPHAYLCLANPSNKSCPLPDECASHPLMSTARTFQSPPASSRVTIQSNKKYLNPLTIDHHFHGVLSTLPLSTSSPQSCTADKAFDPICMAAGTLGTEVEPGYIQTDWRGAILFCRKSACSDTEQCINDPGWDSKEDVPMLSQETDQVRFSQPVKSQPSKGLIAP